MANSRKLPLLLLILAVVTAGLYWQTTRQGFALVDDDDYVSENPWVNEGISWPATRWAFTTFHAANWHPLTWLSHQADWSLYGPFAGGHHLTNVILHAANTLILFLLLRRLTGSVGRSWVVAALFGWHPLHVESVAWIAERKDLLSTLCLLGSIWAYCRYADRRNGRAARWGYYGLALGIFAAGILCKPMIVTLPCLLLLLDYWPLQRVTISPAGPAEGNWLKLFLEKTPFFLLSAGACLVTLAAQHAGQAIKGTGQISLALRGLNSLSAYGDYLRETIWPYPLCAFYPLPDQYPVMAALIGALLLVGLTVAAVCYRRCCPWLLMGWLWFVGGLVPVIGLVQVGLQAHADRYTYIPSIGLFIALVWGIHELAGRFYGGKVVIGLAAASLVACMALTWRQIGFWNNSVELFTYALAHTPNNAFSQNNLGTALSREGKSREAIVHYREAVRLQPRNLGARRNLGIELVNVGELDEAKRVFTDALQLNPQNILLLNNLGAVLAQQGKFAEALDEFLRATRANPYYATSYMNAGVACQALGQAGPAVTNYSAALRLEPDSLDVLRRLSYLLATCPVEPYHQPAQAIELAGRAVNITRSQSAEYLYSLGIACGSAGQYSNAIAADEKALHIAQARAMPDMVATLEGELTVYRAGRNPERDWKQAR